MGHVTITTTLKGQFVIGGLGLAMIKLCTKLEISMFTDYEDMKGNKNYRKWGGLRVKGHSGHRQHSHSTEHKKLPIGLLIGILYCFRVITAYFPKFKGVS